MTRRPPTWMVALAWLCLACWAPTAAAEEAAAGGRLRLNLPDPAALAATGATPAVPDSLRLGSGRDLLADSDGWSVRGDGRLGLAPETALIARRPSLECEVWVTDADGWFRESWSTWAGGPRLEPTPWWPCYPAHGWWYDDPWYGRDRWRPCDGAGLRVNWGLSALLELGLSVGVDDH